MRSRSSFHPIVALATLFLAALPVLPSPSPACDNCPTRHISAYDFNVTVPRPGPAEMASWYSLFFASGAALSAAQSDPTASCLAFYDGVLVHSGRSADTLSFGVASAHTPPAGTIAGTDYVLTGSVTGQAGAYSVGVELQTACSREKAAQGTKAFAAAGDAMEAGRSLAVQTFSPLANTIENFEKQKRDADVLVARFVKDDGIMVKPAKTKAARNEDVSVDITLTDCDGTALVGRTLKLVESQYHGMLLNGSELGAFTAASAVTDAGGVAHAVFKTGNTKGTAILRAYFIYDQPTGCDRVVGGTALVQIEEPPATAYLVSARYSERSTSKMESRGEFNEGGVYALNLGRYTANDTRSMDIWAVCPNTGTEPGVVELASGSVSAKGLWTSAIIHNNSEYGSAAGQTSENKTYSQDDDNGIVIPDESGLIFLYDPGYPEGNSLELSGTAFSRSRKYWWYTDSKKGTQTTSSDTTETLPNHFSLTVPWNGGQGAITRTDSGYTITFTHDTAWTEGADPIYHKTRTIELKATVRPLSAILTTIHRDHAPLSRKHRGRSELSSRLYDILGRWSGAQGRVSAGVYLEDAPAPLRR